MYQLGYGGCPRGQHGVLRVHAPNSLALSDLDHCSLRVLERLLGGNDLYDHLWQVAEPGSPGLSGRNRCEVATRVDMPVFAMVIFAHIDQLSVTLDLRVFLPADAGSKLVMRWYSSNRKATRSASEA